jgi:protease I
MTHIHTNQSNASDLQEDCASEHTNNVSRQSAPHVLMVIAPQDFRDEEFQLPYEALRAAGAQIIVASVHAGVCTGMLGATVSADSALGDIHKSDWDLIVCVGGSGAACYFDDTHLWNLLSNSVVAGLPIAAICIAPTTLAHAGLLKGLRATAWPDCRADLEAHGAQWVDDDVVVDTAKTGATVVTACGPQAAKSFGVQLVDVLAL